MARCQLCGNDRTLIRAHAIPEAFFREVIKDDEHALLVASDGQSFPKRSRIGVYDPTILCDACEKSFSDVDDYGAEVLIKAFDKLFTPIMQGQKIAAFQSDNVDQERLLRFFAATLWRAGVSTQPFYSNVRLGPHEAWLRETLSNPGSALPKTFSVVLSRWTSSKELADLTNGMLSPVFERWNGVNAYRFYFGKTLAYVKVDRRPFRNDLQQLALMHRTSLIVITRDFNTSKDYRAFIGVAKMSRSREG